MKPCIRFFLCLSLCCMLPACGGPQNAGPKSTNSDGDNRAHAQQEPGSGRSSNGSNDAEAANASDKEPGDPEDQPLFTLKQSVIDLGIVCSDFEKSLHFYRDLLGLKVVHEIQVDRNLAKETGLAPRKFRQVRLKAGDTLLKLMEIESPPKERSYEFRAGVRWLTFFVADVPACVARLKAAGVEFMSAEPLSASDAAHVICAKAPDGMLIEFVQLRD